MCDTRPFLAGRSPGESVPEIDGAPRQPGSSAKRRQRRCGVNRLLTLTGYQGWCAISGNPSARQPGARPQGGRAGEGQRGRKGGQVRSSSEAGKVRKSAAFGFVRSRGGTRENSAARRSEVVIESVGTVKVFTIAGSTLRRRHARYGSIFAASACAIRTAPQHLRSQSEESCGLWVRLVFRLGSGNGATRVGSSRCR
jgi:hypothetical protein